MNWKGLQPAFVNAMGYLNVVAGAPGMIVLKIVDIQGRIAKTLIEKVEEETLQLSLNMSDLKEGTYILNAFNEERFIKAMKFIKQ